MFLKRLAGHIRKQDWFIVIVELLVVIVGLVMAFQVDRWRDEVAERKLEGVYIQRLIEDRAWSRPIPVFWSWIWPVPDTAPGMSTISSVPMGRRWRR